MILEYVRYKISSDKIPSFIAAYTEASFLLKSSSHCLGCELSECSEDSGSFIIRIKWDSLDGHINGFRSSEAFNPFLHAVSPFYNNIQEMNHYNVIKLE